MKAPLKVFLALFISICYLGVQIVPPTFASNASLSPQQAKAFQTEFLGTMISPLALTAGISQRLEASGNGNRAGQYRSDTRVRLAPVALLLIVLSMAGTVFSKSKSLDAGHNLAVTVHMTTNNSDIQDLPINTANDISSEEQETALDLFSETDRSRIADAYKVILPAFRDSGLTEAELNVLKNNTFPVTRKNALSVKSVKNTRDLLLGILFLATFFCVIITPSMFKNAGPLGVYTAGFALVSFLGFLFIFWDSGSSRNYLVDYTKNHLFIHPENSDSETRRFLIKALIKKEFSEDRDEEAEALWGLLEFLNSGILTSQLGYDADELVREALRMSNQNTSQAFGYIWDIIKEQPLQNQSMHIHNGPTETSLLNIGGNFLVLKTAALIEIPALLSS